MSIDAIVSFLAVMPDGVIHQASVRPVSEGTYEVNSTITVTDALSPNAYVFAEEADPSPEPVFDDAVNLTDADARLMAGYRALQLHLEFTAGYMPFVETFSDEPADDDDDLDAQEGVLLS